MKHATVDHDPAAQAEVVHASAIYRHGNAVRIVILTLTITGWLLWDIVGWIWYNATTVCDEKLLSDTKYVLLWGTVIDSILAPCICGLFCVTWVVAQVGEQDS